jgi:hypothetical protein
MLSETIEGPDIQFLNVGLEPNGTYNVFAKIKVNKVTATFEVLICRGRQAVAQEAKYSKTVDQLKREATEGILRFCEALTKSSQKPE